MEIQLRELELTTQQQGRRRKVNKKGGKWKHEKEKMSGLKKRRTIALGDVYLKSPKAGNTLPSAISYNCVLGEDTIPIAFC